MICPCGVRDTSLAHVNICRIMRHILAEADASQESIAHGRRMLEKRRVQGRKYQRYRYKFQATGAHVLTPDKVEHYEKARLKPLDIDGAPVAPKVRNP